MREQGIFRVWDNIKEKAVELDFGGNYSTNDYYENAKVEGEGWFTRIRNDDDELMIVNGQHEKLDTIDEKDILAKEGINEADTCLSVS